MKNNVKLFVGIIIGVLITSGVVYATTQIQASNIGYNEGTVQDALDDLYQAKNKVPTQVATITTRGATYTMQNDGYIIGTVQSSYGENGGIVYFDVNNSIDHAAFLAQWDIQTPFNASLYASKGTTVYTRSDAGTYNLTVYEWK